MQKDFNIQLLKQFIKFEELFSNFLSSPDPSIFKCVDLLLKELLKFEFIKKIFVFLTNEETFLFDYFTEYPSSENPQKTDFYEVVGDPELIRTAMLTLQIQVGKEISSNTFNFLIPLLSFNKLLGFAVIKSSMSQENI